MENEQDGSALQAEMLPLLKQMGEGFSAFKAQHTSEVEDLRERLKSFEAKGNRPGACMESMGDDWSNTNRSTGWIDEKGDPIRVLRPNELWAERKAEGIALGDAVRALVTGPRNDFEAKALSEGVTTAGGYTVPAPLATWYIDRLRAKSMVIKAGARTIPMDSQTLAMARLETDPTIGWRAENAAIAEGDPTFGRVMLSARSLAGIVKISRELLADSVNAGAMIENAFLNAMALELDRAAIYGDGGSSSPTGVVNISGINEVSMGTNGAQLTSYDKLIDAIYEMQLDNAGDPTAAIMHPRTGATIAKFKDGQLNPLQVPDLVRAVPMLRTTAAPIAETLGTSTDCSSIVFGDFTQLFIGMREEINIRVLSEAFAGNGQIAILVHTRADVQLAHKESFSRLKGIRP